MKPNLIGILILPVILFATLAPFSLFVGWNLFTLILFWFIIIPLIAVNSSMLLKIKGNRKLQAVVGLIIFYAFMVFMIYKQYKTDYFKIMLVSFAINLVVVALVPGKAKSATQV